MTKPTYEPLESQHCRHTTVGACTFCYIAQKEEIERLKKLLNPESPFICQCEYCQKDDHINCSNPDLMCSCYCEELERLDMIKKISTLSQTILKMLEALNNIKEARGMTEGCARYVSKIISEAQDLDKENK